MGHFSFNKGRGGRRKGGILCCFDCLKSSDLRGQKTQFLLVGCPALLLSKNKTKIVPKSSYSSYSIVQLTIFPSAFVSPMHLVASVEVHRMEWKGLLGSIALEAK